MPPNTELRISAKEIQTRRKIIRKNAIKSASIVNHMPIALPQLTSKNILIIHIEKITEPNAKIRDIIQGKLANEFMIIARTKESRVVYNVALNAGGRTSFEYLKILATIIKKKELSINPKIEDNKPIPIIVFNAIQKTIETYL